MRLITVAILIATMGLNAWAGDDELRLATKMYTSARARKIGDLLTVVVDEKVNSTKEESTATSRESSAALTGSIGDPDGARLSRNLSKIDIPKIGIDGSSTFSGAGSASSSEAFTINFTVRVVDVLDSGVVLIRGDRQIKMRQESVRVVLTGLVRLRDITSANTIRSSQISDAYIRYESNGQVSRDSRPAWLWSLFQRVNPF